MLVLLLVELAIYSTSRRACYCHCAVTTPPLLAVWTRHSLAVPYAQVLSNIIDGLGIDDADGGLQVQPASDTLAHSSCWSPDPELETSMEVSCHYELVMPLRSLAVHSLVVHSLAVLPYRYSRNSSTISEPMIPTAMLELEHAASRNPTRSIRCCWLWLLRSEKLSVLCCALCLCLWSDHSVVDMLDCERTGISVSCLLSAVCCLLLLLLC